jgi:molybdate transport system ATP-binding protein
LLLRTEKLQAQEDINMSSLPILSKPSRTEQNTLYVHLRKHYHSSEMERFHLEIEFEAPPGVTILLGHSGAGKTTLLRCIAGLCNPEEGRIALGDQLLFDSVRRIAVESSRRNVGFVFQDLALFPHLTVIENVAYGLRRLIPSERARRVNSIMESFQIAHLQKRFPREISGGEQQRAALARSLVTEPCVLLLDEPLSSLDTQTKSGIIDDLRGWNETRRIPMLYVTHNHEEVFALGEQVIALKQGRVVAQGAPLDVVPKARRETMVQFAGFENLLEATVISITEHLGTITCSLTNLPLLLDAPLTRVSVGASVQIGIRASEILLASSLPELVGRCNVIQGHIKRINALGPKVEAVVDCGIDLRVHLPASSASPLELRLNKEVWLIVQPHFCHLISRRRFKAMQRLFLFVCNGNTSRSPIAQAICNAEIARRLKVTFPFRENADVQAASAGLSAKSGEPMSRAAQLALDHLRIPVFKHQSQKLNEDLVGRAEAIFCMTRQQRQKLIQQYPSAAMKIRLLDTEMELEEPAENDSRAHLSLARRIEQSVHAQMENLMGVTEISRSNRE